MRDMFDFLKEIFMIKKERASLGLSQFKKVAEPVYIEKEIKKTKEIKISDLLRRA